VNVALLRIGSAGRDAAAIEVFDIVISPVQKVEAFDGGLPALGPVAKVCVQ
jgi:hypothetical protein